MKKLPRFFCDNCGYEVGHEVKSCPYCGRFFASVRCPACDYSGPEKMFLNGCPLCGYSAVPFTGKPLKTKTHRTKRDYHTEPLPFWTYAAAFFALIGAVFLLSWFLTR